MRFDLTQRPWLPVLYRDGTRTEVSLTRAFTDAHEIVQVSWTIPPALSALLRVLSALTYRVSDLDAAAPADPSGWYQARGQVLATGSFDSAKIAEYFTTWAGRFDLFDPHRPWMQDPRLAGECHPSGLNKLVAGRPTGVNGATWFTRHHAGHAPAISPAEAVQHLLLGLYFSAGGRVSARQLPGRKAEAVAADAPLRGTVSYHPTGPTLFHTLLAHLIPPVRALAEGANPANDRCAWETETLPDPTGPRPARPGVLSILTCSAQHAMLLVPDDTGRVTDGYLTWQYADRAPADERRDPFLQYPLKPTKAGGYPPRLARADRALWRDVATLLSAPLPDSDWAQPEVLTHTHFLPQSAYTQVRLTAREWVQDKGKSVDRSWQTSTTPPVLHIAASNPALGALLTAHVAAAETVARQLETALRTTWLTAITPPEMSLDFKSPQRDRLAGPALPRYWDASGRAFWAQVSALASTADPDRATAAATATYYAIARTVFDEATGALTEPRHVQAVLRGLHLLQRAAPTPTTPDDPSPAGTDQTDAPDTDPQEDAA